MLYIAGVLAVRTPQQHHVHYIIVTTVFMIMKMNMKLILILILMIKKMIIYSLSSS